MDHESVTPDYVVVKCEVDDLDDDDTESDETTDIKGRLHKVGQRDSNDGSHFKDRSRSIETPSNVSRQPQATRNSVASGNAIVSQSQRMKGSGQPMTSSDTTNSFIFTPVPLQTYKNPFGAVSGKRKTDREVRAPRKQSKVSKVTTSSKQRSVYTSRSDNHVVSASGYSSFNNQRPRLPQVTSFKCAVCQKEFEDPACMFTHSLSHVRNKSFQCKDCGLRLANYEEFEQHMEFHRGPDSGVIGITSRAVVDSFRDKVTSEPSRKLPSSSGNKSTVSETPSIPDCSDEHHSTAEIDTFSANESRDDEDVGSDSSSTDEDTNGDTDDDDDSDSDEHGSLPGTSDDHDSLPGTPDAESPKTKRKMPLQCSQCDEVFFEPSLLGEHLYSYHKDVFPPYRCKICMRKLSTISGFVRHLNRHTKGKLYCKRTPDVTETECRTDEQTMKFLCPVCSEVFTVPILLTDHIIVTHKDSKPPYTCNLCSTKLTTLSGYRKHMDRHVKPKKRRKKNGETFDDREDKESVFPDCPFCFQKYRSIRVGGKPSNMSYHKCEKMTNLTEITPDTSAGTHTNKPATDEAASVDNSLPNPSSPDKPLVCPYGCKLCGRTYLNKRKLGNHIRQSHHKKHVEPTPTQCPECGKIYATRGGMQSHMRIIHTDVKSFLCEICSKSFRRKADWKGHMRRHRNEYRFECDICGMKFYARQVLSEHRNTHTDERPWACKICGKSFRQSNALRFHASVHSEEKNFKCELCGRTYKMRKSLMAHMKFHSGLRPFVCEICGHTFVFGGNLNAHMRTVHLKKVTDATGSME